MKRFSAHSIFGLFVLVSLGGCKASHLNPAGSSPGAAAVKSTPLTVTVEDGSKMPDFLIGTWKAQPPYKWEITIAADGTIPKIYYPIARMSIDVASRLGYKTGREGAFWKFELGQCDARYNPATRRLSVGITVDSFHTKSPVIDMSGNMNDSFDGAISEDGKSWTAQWLNIAVVPGLQNPDPNSIKPRTVVFTKVSGQ